MIHRTATWSAALAALGMLALSMGTRADEEKVPLSQVPRAVLDAVKAKFPGATLKQAEKEVDAGKTTFEIGLTHQGHAIDVALKPDGTILEIEKQVKPADLPKAVTEALKAKYPRGTVKKAEEITSGKTVNFEVLLANGDKTTEVKLDPRGTILETEEGDEKD